MLSHLRHELTLLNITRIEIFLSIKEINFLKDPQSMKISLEKRDQKVFVDKRAVSLKKEHIITWALKHALGGWDK